jgi:hypothetical protein
MRADTLKWFAVTGRIPGDDEDVMHVFECDSRDRAMELFTEAMREGQSTDDREAVCKEHGQACFINSICWSRTQIFAE